MKSLAKPVERLKRIAGLRFIERDNLKIIVLSQKTPHPRHGYGTASDAKYHPCFVDVHRRDEQAICLLDFGRVPERIGLPFKDGNEGGTVNHDHKVFISCMISRGLRGSSNGRLAISSPTASICALVIRRRGRARPER